MSTTALRANSAGGYAFIPSPLGFASAGVVALPGMAIERAVLPPAIAVPRGLEAARQHLERIGRPLDALCGMELRMPEILTRPNFQRFNEGYLDDLRRSNFLHDQSAPMTRTNVVPYASGSPEATVLAFSYTVPASTDEPTFILSGVPELPEVYTFPDDIVRRGDVGPEALAAKATCAVERLDAYIETLGATWSSATIHLYSHHDLTFAFQREVLASRGVQAEGLVWYDAAPPIVELELEADVRRSHRQIAIPAAR